MKIRGSLVVCLGLYSLSAVRGQQYTIQTITGNGSPAYTGDGGSAIAAQLSNPSAVALDSKGNIYIADTGNHCIRVISSSTSLITTYAGTCATAGYDGDGAAATSAHLSSPGGLVFDSGGNLYIADTVNAVIRKVTGANISTVAGDHGQVASYGGDLGPATSANINNPTTLAFDSAGNYYIADTGNNLIRRVDIKTGIITTYVGGTGGSNGTSGKLLSPNGLWVASDGTLYIVDSGHQRLATYVPPAAFNNFAGNQTAAFSGDGGTATSATFNKPTGIAFDAAGNIYVADTNNCRIRKINTNGIITTIAGSKAVGYTGDGGDATAAALNFPRSIAVGSDGKVYVADTGNHVIRVLTPSYPAITGVGNAASYAARISPGGLASIFGSGFGTSTFQADTGYTWPTVTPGQVGVKVNGVSAPLYYVSPGQINFQVPWATPSTGSVNVAVIVNGGSSNVASVPVGTAAPGLFYDPSSGSAIVQNTPDYSLNSSSNPAPAGSTIIAYLTGSGPVSPAVKDGAPAPASPLSWATAAYSAKIGSTTATVSFAGLTPYFTGLAQMNIVVPATLSPGTYPLTVTIDGQTSNSATISVK